MVIGTRQASLNTGMDSLQQRRTRLMDRNLRHSVTCGVMSAVITHSPSTTEVLLRVRVHTGIVVAGGCMSVTLAESAVVRLHQVPCSERLVVEEWFATFTLSSASDVNAKRQDLLRTQYFSNIHTNDQANV